MDHTESLAVVGEGVMEAAADIDADAPFKRHAPRKNRSARRKPNRMYKLRRIGDLHPEYLNVRKLPIFELPYVVAIVHQRHVFVTSSRRLNNVFRLNDAFLEKFLLHQPVLRRRKDMVAQVKV